MVHHLYFNILEMGVEPFSVQTCHCQKKMGRLKTICNLEERTEATTINHIKLMEKKMSRNFFKEGTHVCKNALKLSASNTVRQNSYELLSQTSETHKKTKNNQCWCGCGKSWTLIHLDHIHSGNID